MIKALEFVHLSSVGNLELCRKISDDIFPTIKKMYDQNLIEGYRVSVVKDLDGVNYHVLEHKYEHLTNDVFPFLYIAIQPVSKDNIQDFRNLITPDFSPMKDRFEK